MRKTALLLAAMALSSVCIYAQTANDALLFSEDSYTGTARTAAMGNAFTALGGDIGSIGINPAGSAVAKYSQIALTPSVSISTSTTAGVSPYNDGSLPYFDRTMKNTSALFRLPNIGFTYNIDTHRKTGLKNVTVGFVANSTNSWNEDTYASGRNSTTSFMGSMAAGATASGWLGSRLNLDGAYDYFPWKDVVGYQSGMISTFGGYDDQFVGATEGIYQNGNNLEIALAGPIDQKFGRRVRGSKYEYLINLGANISDFIYIGANLGMTSMTYSYTEYFKEAAVDPQDFEIELDNGQKMYFRDMAYKYNYEANTAGFFGKIGIIVTPGAGLRLGAAISTPTLTNIKENWNHFGETNYTDSRYDAYASSPEGEDSYSFRAPYKANFGVAWTIKKRMVISADYELCDYKTMKFKTSVLDDRSMDYFNDVNKDIRSRYGISHTFRAGAEVKFFNALAVRAGYGISTAAEKLDYKGERFPEIYTHNASFGIGYSSKGSFFADAACVNCFATTEGKVYKEYIMPYEDYIFDDGGAVISYAPEIMILKSAWKVLFTIGWRF